MCSVGCPERVLPPTPTLPRKGGGGRRVRLSSRLAVLACVLISVACGPAASHPSAPSGGGASASSSTGNRAPRGSITIAWAREPENLSPKFLGGGGGSEPSWVFSSALTYYDL